MRRLIAGVLLTMCAACGKPPELAADKAWVRLAAVTGRPAAGYATLHGGAADATLVAVQAKGALRTELHEMKALPNGAMSMAALASLPVPARGEVKLAPGGRHLMLFDVDPAVKPGATLPLTFRFADGAAVQANARVIAAGDPAPK